MQKRILSIYGAVLFFVVFLMIYFNVYDVKNISYKQYIKDLARRKEESFQYYDSQDDETLNHLYRTIDGKHAINTDEMKYILFWDDFFGGEGMNLGLGSDIFKGCPVSTCYTTHNRSYMPVEQFDAIIFHAARWDSGVSGVPDKRTPKQKYIFFSWESPYNTYYDKGYINDFYNWTLNYRRDADIHFPYRMFLLNNETYHMPTADDLKTKHKMAMWMVSNCITPGTERRQKYVEELQKYINVDIYGSCGTMQCENTEVCRKILEDNYYFYLAFENTQTLDYVTEKMYDTMLYNVIPVVLGNADYNNIVPKHSVIDTRDFATPKILAEYLVQLKNNFSEYTKYFEWKKKYYVGSSGQYARCQLCEMLHRPLEYKSYENIEDWYFGVNSYLK